LAQFRSTADILDLALQKAGEVTNGNSAYETQALNYLNRVHYTITTGGTIPVGKDSTVEIDEIWPWAKAKNPILIELQPKYTTGTVTLTVGSEAGVFSSAPTSSLVGYHIRIDGRNEWFKIASHTASSTDFELDGGYPDASGSGLTFRAIKIDYDLVPDFITINTGNNKIQFQKVAGTTITGTLTAGTYSPSDLITHVASVMTAATTVITITGSYSTTTRKFTLTSDLAGASAFYIVGNGDQSGFSVHKTLGYDDSTSSASAAAQTSTYVLGGVSRLIEPFKINKGYGSSVSGLDAEAFDRHYPINTIEEGYPDRFHVLKESADGTFTVRFNAYPIDKTRIEVDHIPIPRDLKDDATSVPLIPRKHVDVLEDACVFYLMLDKSDDRMQLYANLMQGKLKAMIAQHRGSLVRTGENFGSIVPRQDLTGHRRSLFKAEPY